MEKRMTQETTLQRDFASPRRRSAMTRTFGKPAMSVTEFFYDDDEPVITITDFYYDDDANDS